MVNPEKLASGLTSFAETEVLPALDGWRLIVGSAAVSQLSQRASALLGLLKDDKLIAALGLIDENGNFNADAAAAALKESVKKNGKLEFEVPLLGELKFGESDIDKLLEYIKKA